MPVTMDDLVRLSKARGFVYPSAEIYGGFRSTYDYGPLGVLMYRNVKDAWWRSMVQLRREVVGLDAAVLSSPKIWEASGHLANFTDPLVDCRSCKQRWRADHLEMVAGATLGDEPIATCPNCGAHDFTEARPFNLMFKTFVGPVEDDANVAYLRPETAQGHFVNFANVLQSEHLRPPFGTAQIGKSFRNEITPGNFVFRTREFEQMELEYFVPPADAGRWFEYWCNERFEWYVRLGIPREMLRLRPHTAEELSHYSTQTSDVEFQFPWGWGELEGIANRTDFDLKAHSTASGRALRDRAGGGPGPHHDGFPHSRLHHRRGGGRAAHRAQVAPAYRPLPGGGVAAVEKGHPGAAFPGSPPAPPAGGHVRLRRHAFDRPALPAPGRGRHAAVRHRRFRFPGGQGGDRAGPGLHHPGARPDRPAGGSHHGPSGLVNRRLGRAPTGAVTAPP
jgi:tRNA synthetase class II core domain (G, H, P, S and T)